MSEWIKKEEVLKQIDRWFTTGEYKYSNATHYLNKRISSIKSGSEWISVKDRMPDVHFNILVYCGGNEYHIARIDKYLRWYVEDGDYQLENEPEMWMLLPESEGS